MVTGFCPEFRDGLRLKLFDVVWPADLVADREFLNDNHSSGFNVQSALWLRCAWILRSGALCSTPHCSEYRYCDHCLVLHCELLEVQSAPLRLLAAGGFWFAICASSQGGSIQRKSPPLHLWLTG